jgi:hypothetical protein
MISGIDKKTEADCWFDCFSFEVLTWEENFGVLERRVAKNKCRGI